MSITQESLESAYQTFKEEWLEASQTECLPHLEALGISSLSKRTDLLEGLGKKINELESFLKNKFEIDNFSSTKPVKHFLDKTLSLAPTPKGLFIKSEAADRIIAPFFEMIGEVSSNLIQGIDDPLAQLATIRFFLDQSNNQALISSIQNLTAWDFELRHVRGIVIDHKKTPELAQIILKKKCFNTHDKLTGTHVITTIPETHQINSKPLTVRTFSKLFHYQKELSLFGSGFLAQKSNPKLGEFISQSLLTHGPSNQTSLFSIHEIIEGLSNLSIRNILLALSKGFPELRPWAELHDMAVTIDDQFTFLSLWRLSAWQLKGTQDHSTQMFDQALRAKFLQNHFPNKNLEEVILQHLNQQDMCLGELLSTQ